MGVARWAQRRFAHLYQAGRGREGTGSHEIGRGVRRDDMDHVEPLFDPRELITALLFKCCDPGFSVDGDQSGFQVKMRTVALDIFHKRRHIDWHTEQNGTAGVELHFDVLEDSGALPDVPQKEHGLLWSTNALYL